MARVHELFAELQTEVIDEVGRPFAQQLLDEAQAALEKERWKEFHHHIDQLESELAEREIPGSSTCIDILNHFAVVAA